jgi:bifunctional enzyme CysN/CysC
MHSKKVADRPIYAPDAEIARDISSYLARHSAKPMLRFITCGSVDDGKSTLIGRLLYDNKMIFDDQLSALEADSKRTGTQGKDIDFALLVDGLAAEREQGITIDVAYRYFATEKRKFIVADCPGHEQYTRNMVTGASTADLAIILVDARKGVLPQTRRHSFLVHLLGVRNIMLAVNKMDLVDYDQATFDAICTEYTAFARSIGLVRDIRCIPISGLKGDNIIARSQKMPWYQGEALLPLLETIDLTLINKNDEPSEHVTIFRMPVQWVNRPNLDFRGFAGAIASGEIAVGDAVRILPSRRSSHIARIVSMDGDLQSASVGQSITLTLADDVDCSRGDVIVSADDTLQNANTIDADIVWMADAPMLPGRSYWIKLATQTHSVTLDVPSYKIDITTLKQEPSPTLRLNDIGRCTLKFEKPMLAVPFAENPMLGGFILIDKQDNSTIAGGIVRTVTQNQRNILWQNSDVTRASRARMKGQEGKILWFTGLSGSGKSTIANLVEKKLHAIGRHTFLLDGDNIRHGLCRDLGFGEADRIENIRRVAAVARLMSDAGLIVITALISPFAADRHMARMAAAEGEFLEIYINTPLDIAETRDPKGLYKKARAGEIKDFTGIDSPYEPPEKADIMIDTVTMRADQAAEFIVQQIIGDWAYQI